MLNVEIRENMSRKVFYSLKQLKPYFIQVLNESNLSLEPCYYSELKRLLRYQSVDQKMSQKSLSNISDDWGKKKR